MTRPNRRRFLTIAAGALGAAALPAQAATLHRWQGIAMGAQATILIAHPDAQAITARAEAEIARLEAVFSLFRPDSALSRLNAVGRLGAPPFELLECLALAGQVNRASGGLFDPTIQPLWALYAESHAARRTPTDNQIAAAMARTGWHRLRFDSAGVTMDPGMALTLNGIAQGFVADRVAGLLRAEGLDDILIDTGEMRALGGHPEGGAWPVALQGGGAVALRDRALATSAPLGTVFDAGGRVGHILHPQTGSPDTGPWRRVSISAPRAAVADALSTAACLMPGLDVVIALVAAFEAARIEALD